MAKKKKKPAERSETLQEPTDAEPVEVGVPDMTTKQPRPTVTTAPLGTALGVTEDVEPVKVATETTGTQKVDASQVVHAPAGPASVTIEVPLGDLPPPGTYVTRHVEVQFDESYPVQKETMCRLLDGLQRAGEKLASGKVVGSNADAIRWVLEQMGGMS